MENLRKQTILKNFDLAVNYNDFSWYLKSKIAECMISNNKITIKVKIPLKSIENKYKIYELYPQYQGHGIIRLAI